MYRKKYFGNKVTLAVTIVLAFSLFDARLSNASGIPSVDFLSIAKNEEASIRKFIQFEQKWLAQAENWKTNFENWKRQFDALGAGNVKELLGIEKDKKLGGDKNGALDAKEKENRSKEYSLLKTEKDKYDADISNVCSGNSEQICKDGKDLMDLKYKIYEESKNKLESYWKTYNKLDDKLKSLASSANDQGKFKIVAAEIVHLQNEMCIYQNSISERLKFIDDGIYENKARLKYVANKNLHGDKDQSSSGIKKAISAVAGNLSAYFAIKAIERSDDINSEKSKHLY